MFSTPGRHRPLRGRPAPASTTARRLWQPAPPAGSSASWPLQAPPPACTPVPSHHFTSVTRAEPKACHRTSVRTSQNLWVAPGPTRGQDVARCTLQPLELPSQWDWKAKGCHDSQQRCPPAQAKQGVCAQLKRRRRRGQRRQQRGVQLPQGRGDLVSRGRLQHLPLDLQQAEVLVVGSSFAGH